MMGYLVGFLSGYQKEKKKNSYRITVFFVKKPCDTSAACVKEKTIYCSNLLIFTTEQITIYVHL